MSQVSLGRPEFVPGTPPGHPDRQIPLCDFSLSVFSLHTELVFSPRGSAGVATLAPKGPRRTKNPLHTRLVQFDYA